MLIKIKVLRFTAEAAEPTKKTQRTEGGREGPLLFFRCSPHLFSLRFLSGLCDSALNWHSWKRKIPHERETYIQL